jgi:hypothetical protein
MIKQKTDFPVIFSQKHMQVWLMNDLLNEKMKGATT